MWARNLCNGLGYHLQHLEKHAKPIDTYTRLIVFFWLQIKIAYWLFKILIFLKFCVSQNWGDILESNVDVNWHSFLILRTSRDTLDLKLSVKSNLSNIDTARPFVSSFLLQIIAYKYLNKHVPCCVKIISQLLTKIRFETTVRDKELELIRIVITFCILVALIFL